MRACAKIVAGPQERERIIGLLGSDVNWGRLLWLLHYHGVAPLASKVFTSLGEAHAPSQFRETLSKEARTAAAKNTFLLQEIERLARILERERIQALLYKGISLGALAYGSIDLRPCVDIDLLISRSDLPAVEAAMREDGYTLLKDPRRAARAVRFFFEHELTFTRNLVFNLDIHTSAVSPNFSYRTDFDFLWSRSLEAPFRKAQLQSSLRQLGPEDQLLILCFHGQKNRWKSLKYITDIAALVSAYPSLDWADVLLRARRMAGTRILLMGLCLAHHVLSAPVPDQMLKLRDPVVERAAKHIMDTLPQRMTGEEEENLFERIGMPVGMQDTFYAKARYGTYSLLRKLVMAAAWLGVLGQNTGHSDVRAQA